MLEDDGEFVDQLPVFIVSSLLCFIICSLERFKSKVMTTFQEMEYTVLQRKIASIKSPPLGPLQRIVPSMIAPRYIAPEIYSPLNATGKIALQKIPYRCFSQEGQ